MLQRCLTHTDKFRNVEKLIQSHFLDAEPKMPHSLLRTSTWVDTDYRLFNKCVLAK